MTDQRLSALGNNIEDLIELCSQLNEENRTLKTNAGNWLREREILVEKTEIARTRVKSMIVRLKSLEKQ